MQITCKWSNHHKLGLVSEPLSPDCRDGCLHTFLLLIRILSYYQFKSESGFWDRQKKGQSIRYRNLLPKGFSDKFHHMRIFNHAFIIHFKENSASFCPHWCQSGFNNRELLVSVTAFNLLFRFLRYNTNIFIGSRVLFGTSCSQYFWILFPFLSGWVLRSCMG